MTAQVAVHFSRGTGLGNRLFPWARSRIYARTHNLQCLDPWWLIPRKGSLLKGGIDYSKALRKILLLDNFKCADSDLRRYWIPRNQLRMTELDTPPTDGFVHVFAGDADFFRPLHEHSDFIRNKILEMTKEKWIRRVENTAPADICANIRLGRDFNVAQSEADFKSRGGLLTPLHWFRESIIHVRHLTNRNCSVRIVSDGTEKQLQPLLELGNVQFLNSPAAITDLLIASRSRLILGSGGSSFSAWASFLGQTPIASIPGQSFSWFKLNEQRKFGVLELDPRSPDDQTNRAIQAAFQ